MVELAPSWRVLCNDSAKLRGLTRSWSLNSKVRIPYARKFLFLVRPDGLLAADAARPPLRSGPPPRVARQRPTRRCAGLSNRSRCLSAVRIIASRTRSRLRFSGPLSLVRPDGLLAAAPLGLRCAAARRRCAASSNPAAPGCRTRLVVRREFELGLRSARNAEHFSVRKFVVRPERFELPTTWFEARCSIQLSYGRARAV